MGIRRQGAGRRSLEGDLKSLRAQPLAFSQLCQVLLGLYIYICVEEAKLSLGTIQTNYETHGTKIGKQLEQQKGTRIWFSSEAGSWQWTGNQGVWVRDLGVGGLGR